MRAKFSIDPRILEAGSAVAERRGIPRKELFRSRKVADILREYEEMQAEAEGSSEGA